MTQPQAASNKDEVEPYELGMCNVVVDASTTGKEVVCGDWAVDEILVRNKFGLFVIPICRDHKREHQSFYDALRKMQGRPIRRINPSA